ncbi:MULTISPECIES: signal peptidase II [Enterococcus]|uniref:Lipoprotein signal peptidase n=1 Tax=Enterococcus alishanensis TaxID=1303817 RepID=A0ABS6TBC6_9ENTE|nr:signal peptidase II [Enterococcus alishanensis]MBV7390205.1 signal peptidase II [Enterococcus alishanensis]
MLIIYLLFSGVIIGLDQLMKFWTVENFFIGQEQSLIPNVFSLTYLQNTGGAFSLLEGQRIFFIIISIVAVIVVVYFLHKYLKESKWLTIGLSLFLAGAIGNFIDRFRLGYVVDMFQLDFVRFPIFNIADMALTIGVALIIIYLFLDEREKKHAS